MLYIFKSTHDVIKAERYIRQEGIECDIIPTPREYSSECGISLQIDDAQLLNKIEEILKRVNIKEYRRQKNV